MKSVFRNYLHLYQAIFLACFLFICSAQTAGASKPGWLIRQNSQTYGIVKTLVSADGIHLEMGEIKVGINGPDWIIKFWNQRTKYYFEETLQQFQERVPKRVFPKGWLKKVIAFPPYEETIAGIKAKHYRWIAYDPKVPQHQRVIFDYACTESLGLPQKLNDVCAICCYVPPGKGLPLRVTGSGNIVYLQTTLIKKATVDPALFKLPKGYTKVKAKWKCL